MKWPTTVAILCLALTLIAGCGGETDPSASEPEAASASREYRVRVRTETIEPEPFEDELEISCVIRPWQEVTVAAELGGLVRERNFDKGDSIPKGKVLARVGDDIIAAQLAQAEADLMAAEANYQKTSKLFERQAVPQQDLVAATSRRDRARAVVDEMKLRLDRAVIRAPIAGLAVSRLVEPGEVIGPGTALTTLQQIDRLKVECQVADTEIGWIRVDRPATVSVDAWPGEFVDASVSYVASAADDKSRQFLFELELPNPRRRLRPGMVARVRLVKRRLEQAVVIPVDAMVPFGDGHAVFVVEDCTARRIPLEPEAIEQERALIAGALEAGQELVVDGQRDLGDAVPVLAEGCE